MTIKIGTMCIHMSEAAAEQETPVIKISEGQMDVVRAAVSNAKAFYDDVSETTSKVLAEVSELDLVTELTGPDRGAAIMAIEHIVFVHAKGADGFLDKGKADAVWEAVLAGLGVDVGAAARPWTMPSTGGPILATPTALMVGPAARVAVYEWATESKTIN